MHKSQFLYTFWKPDHKSKKPTRGDNLLCGEALLQFKFSWTEAAKHGLDSSQRRNSWNALMHFFNSLVRIWDLHLWCSTEVSNKEIMFRWHVESDRAQGVKGAFDFIFLSTIRWESMKMNVQVVQHRKGKDRTHTESVVWCENDIS